MDDLFWIEVQNVNGLILGVRAWYPGLVVLDVSQTEGQLVEAAEDPFDGRPLPVFDVGFEFQLSGKVDR